MKTIDRRIKLKSSKKFEPYDEINVRLINIKTGRRKKKHSKCEVISCEQIDDESYNLELEVLDDEE